MEATVALAAEMLVLGRLQPDHAAARRAIETAFSSGRAAEVFGRMVSALGGPADFVERPDAYLAAAPWCTRCRHRDPARCRASTPARSVSPSWRSVAAA